MLVSEDPFAFIDAMADILRLYKPPLLFLHQQTLT